MTPLLEYIRESVSTGTKGKGKYTQLKHTDGLLEWVAILKSVGLRVERRDWFEEIKPGIVNYVLYGNGSTQLQFSLGEDLFRVNFSKNGAPGDIYTTDSNSGGKRWMRCFVDFVNTRLHSMNESVSTGKRSRYDSKLDMTGEEFEHLIEKWGVGVKRAPQSRTIPYMVDDATKTKKVIWRPDQSGMSFYIATPNRSSYEVMFSRDGYVSEILIIDKVGSTTLLRHGVAPTKSMEEEFDKILKTLGIL